MVVSTFPPLACPFYRPSLYLLDDNDTNYSRALLIARPRLQEEERRKKIEGPSFFPSFLSANLGFPGPIVMSTGPAAIPL